MHPHVNLLERWEFALNDFLDLLFRRRPVHGADQPEYQHRGEPSSFFHLITFLRPTKPSPRHLPSISPPHPPDPNDHSLSSHEAAHFRHRLGHFLPHYKRPASSPRH